jgi:hypothetical protein
VTGMAKKLGGPGGAPPPPAKKKKSSEKAEFIWAEGQQESGGNYRAVNPGSGALGRYQVLPENLPGWLHESGLPAMSDQEYLDDPKAQDTLAWDILGGDFDKYGPAGAAAVWYSGQPDPKATYGDPPVYQYVNDVLKLMKAAPYLPAGPGNLEQSGTIGPQTVAVPSPPKPGKENWSAQINTSSQHFRNSARDFDSRASLLSKLTVRR